MHTSDLKKKAYSNTPQARVSDVGLPFDLELLCCQLKISSGFGNPVPSENTGNLRITKGENIARKFVRKLQERSPKGLNL